MPRLCTTMLLFLPLFAASTVVAAPLAAQSAERVQTVTQTPWNGDKIGPVAPAATPDNVLEFDGPAFSAKHSQSHFQFMLAPHWRAHARADQQTWRGAGQTATCLAANPALRPAGCNGQALAPSLIYGEIGAGFSGAGFSLDLNISSSRPAPRSPLLPRVLPQAIGLAPTVNGLPFDLLQGGTSVRAHGRVALGSRSGIDFGASVGRIRLLPNNVLGIHMLGQKSLSLGLDSGPISGRIVGRLIQPETGPSTSLLGPERRWTSIDLGVTWRLPWQGSLSFGAQNVWSSGEAPKAQPDARQDATSIPYVQYHQDF